MNNTRGYEIKFEAKQIIITKRFEKAANNYGSVEYKTLLGLRSDFPDFAIKVKTIEKKENKVSYSGLNIYKMKAAIFFLTKDKETVELFEKYEKVYEGQKGKYATLKKLFLDKYKEDYNNLSVADMAEVDKIAREYEAAEKAA